MLTLKIKTMRLGITQNHFLAYLGIIGVGLVIVYTMRLIPESNTTATPPPMAENAKTLRHVVLFKFKEGTTAAEQKAVETAFAALPAKIPEIAGFEWGTNNSPEGLDKGFTHCFFLSFDSEADRDVYLPHPDHKAFGEIATPHIEDVLVVDYWTE